MIDFDTLAAANRRLNAFLDWDRDARGGEGPLGGLTVGVKANIAVAGLPFHGGIEGYRTRIALLDAEVVRRLRAAGAAIIGTLNMEEAALGAVSRNPWFGTVNNPHALDRTAGGSSGGSGAAVAAGLCDLALGTDTMGSIRIPAAYCGVYGFKPANGAVSQDGLEIAEAELDCIGPLARSLDLLERAARIVSGFGAGTVGETILLAGLGGVACEPVVLDAYAAAAAGARDGLALAHPLSRIRYAGFVKTARALSASLAGMAEGGISPDLRKLIGYGPRRSNVDWAEDLAILAETRGAIGAALAGGAVLLMPTAPQLPFSHTAPAPPNQADFTCLANIAGCAAISLPAGWSADGLPVGVQLVAAPGREAGLFAAAARLDAALAAYRRPPCFFEGEAP